MVIHRIHFRESLDRLDAIRRKEDAALRPLSDADILADYQDYPLEERGILAGRELARRLDAGSWTLGAAV